MSTIRCIYSELPEFPATAQHPDAVRYGPFQVEKNSYYVDAIGGEPTIDEINAVFTISKRRLVPKSLMVDRLQEMGKLDAARFALNASDLYTQERWNTRDSIYSDDPTAIALLQAIGADHNVIMAP